MLLALRHACCTSVIPVSASLEAPARKPTCVDSQGHVFTSAEVSMPRAAKQQRNHCTHSHRACNCTMASLPCMSSGAGPLNLKASAQQKAFVHER